MSPPRSIILLRSPALSTPFHPLHGRRRRWRCRGVSAIMTIASRMVASSLQDRKVLPQHDLIDTNDELSSERAARMNPGEVLALEIPSPEAARPPARRRGPAPRWCSSSAQDRAGTLPRAPPRRATRRSCAPAPSATSPVMAMVRTPNPFKCANSASSSSDSPLFEMRIATSSRPDDAEVAVHAVHGMEKARRRAGGGERRGDLAADQPRLAHARNDHAARRLGDQPHGAGELVAEPRLDRATSASRSSRMTRLPRSTISARPSRVAPLGVGAIARRSRSTPSSHSPRALSKSSTELAHGAAAARVRRAARDRSRRISGHGIADGDRQAHDPQHGQVGKVVADERALARRRCRGVRASA